MLRFSCLARMSPLKHNCYLHTKVHILRLSFLAVFHNCCHSSSRCSWLSEKPSSTKILLTFHTWPAAIALNYSVKNIRNDVHQLIYIYIYEKSQFNSLVWGSLTLAPIKFHVQFNTSLLASNSRFSFQILF